MYDVSAVENVAIEVPDIVQKRLLGAKTDRKSVLSLPDRMHDAEPAVG